jgi:hypothetical protein
MIALGFVIASLGATVPAAYYRFENVSDPTVDSSGLCALQVPSHSTAPVQVQDASASSVGRFLVFQYGFDVLPVETPGLQWGSILLVTTIQRLSNNARNLGSSGPAVKAAVGRPCTVRVPGLGSPLTVHVRPQGSVYVVVPAPAAGGAPTITQLDSWHEASHPTLWKDAARYEAELFEGRAAGGAAAVVTELAPGAAHALDFSGFTTYVDLSRAPRPLCIQVHPAPARKRGAAPPAASARRRVKLFARGGSVSVNGGARVAAAAGREWQWLEHDGWSVARTASTELEVCLAGDAQVDVVEVGP